MRLPTGVVLDGIDMTVDNSIKRSVFEKSPSRAFWDGVVHYVGRIFIHRAGVLKITQANLWMGNVPSYSDGESVNKNSTVIISIVRKEEEIIYSRVSNSFDGKWGNEGGSDYVFWHVVCRDGYYRKKIFILFFSNWLERMVGLVFLAGNVWYTSWVNRGREDSCIRLHSNCRWKPVQMVVHAAKFFENVIF